MPLNSKTPGLKTESSYFKAIGINKSDLSLIKIPYKPEKAKINSFLKKFVNEYDKYAKAGTMVLPLPNPDGGNKSILEKAFLKTEGNGKDNSVLIGTAFANYWFTMWIDTPANLGPGADTPVSVINDATAFTSLFIAAVKASYTTKSDKFFFERLVKNVEKVVNQITWTVTQLGPPPVKPTLIFPCKLS